MLACRHCGRLHYGPYGAAGLVLANGEGEVLLARRSDYVHRGGTWAFPGGALEYGETDIDCAVREAEEELGINRESVVVGGTVPGLDHGSWRYTYVLATVAPERPVVRFRLNWETDEVAWVPLDRVHALSLHPDLATAWPTLRDLW
jgi:8-oxo-dGTP pyrophosphatase MutT (NUDIX family)